MIKWEAHACLPLHPQADFGPIEQFHFGGIKTPVEPATGSTITAAIFDASCKATIPSNSSAKCAPHSGCLRLKALCSKL